MRIRVRGRWRRRQYARFWRSHEGRQWDHEGQRGGHEVLQWVHEWQRGGHEGLQRSHEGQRDPDS
eukprot:5655258-Pyramimonas_sp.AAC.1